MLWTFVGALALIQIGPNGLGLDLCGFVANHVRFPHPLFVVVPVLDAIDYGPHAVYPLRISGQAERITGRAGLETPGPLNGAEFYTGIMP